MLVSDGMGHILITLTHQHRSASFELGRSLQGEVCRPIPAQHGRRRAGGGDAGETSAPSLAPPHHEPPFTGKRLRWTHAAASAFAGQHWAGRNDGTEVSSRSLWIPGNTTHPKFITRGPPWFGFILVLINSHLTKRYILYIVRKEASLNFNLNTVRDSTLKFHKYVQTMPTDFLSFLYTTTFSIAIYRTSLVFPPNLSVFGVI